VTIQDLGSLGELVAAVATIATLVYLAIQIRQNTESVRMSAEMGISEQAANWASRVTADPDLGRIYDKAVNDHASLDATEKRRFIWFVSELFLLYEGHYQLYLKGHIDERSWKAKVNNLLGLITNPIIGDWWSARIAPFSPDYYEYIESLRLNYDGSWKHKNIGDVDVSS
jgi:hypothetical protein